MPAQVINKGIPTAELLTQVLVAKYSDHLPLYRQERIFDCAGLTIPRSTLAAWLGTCGVQLQPLVDALRNVLLQHTVLHADETPVSILAPGKKKTHRAYVWADCTTPFSDLSEVIYEFAPSSAGEHARSFLGTGKANWSATITQVIKRASATASPKSVAWLMPGACSTTCTRPANKSELAAQALEYIGQL